MWSLLTSNSTLSDLSRRVDRSEAGATGTGHNTVDRFIGGAPAGAPPIICGAFSRGATFEDERRPSFFFRCVRGIGRRLLILLAVVLWVGAVVYPDPRPFVGSMDRLFHPPIDAVAASGLAAELPADYGVIEDFTLSYVPFATAWETYGLPWYYPTVEEVIRDKAGDCQARAILLGSILEAKGMPYTMYYSFDHVWIDYPGKTATSLDDPSTSFVGGTDGGWWAGLPDKIPLGSIIKERVAYHWTPMPVARKFMLVLGAMLIICYGERRLLRRAGRPFLAGLRRVPYVGRWT